MFQSNVKINLLAVLAAACFLALADRSDNPARAQNLGQFQPPAQAPGHDAHQHAGGASHAATAPRAVHGGQVTAVQSHVFEVVYRPREIRVYLFAPTQQPVTARGVQGQVAMQVRGNNQVYRYPLKYVAPPAGANAQDCLALAVDVSRIRDGDMTVTVELTNLPSGQQPQASFTQTFALSKPPVQVTMAALTAADQPGIARQQVCPVMGTRLGGHGTPLKVLIGGKPLYLCCKGCLGKLKQNPQGYLAKAATPSPANQIAVTTATAADQAAIRAQRVCAVANSPLGGMGTPVKVTINGQSLFLCCKGCLAKVEKDPQGYLAKAAQLRSGQ